MIFLIYGNDFKNRNHQKNKIVETLKSKRSDSVFSIIDKDEFDENFLKNSISSFGLFDQKSIFEIRGCFEKKENEELFQEYLEDLDKSENAFVFSEEKISLKTKKLIEKVGVKNYFFEEKVFDKKINVFKIADLFLSKDKKNLWITYRDFIEKGIPEEEIFGIIFWAIKNLNMISSSKSIKETSIKPFVYNKNKKYLNLWEEKEISEKMFNMIDIYHKSRRGLCDFKVEFEKIIIS